MKGNRSLLGIAAAALAWPVPLAGQPAPGAVAADAQSFRADARSIEALINARYAYPERLGGRYVLSERLRAEAERVGDRRALLRFAERVMLTLADHHAITGASFADSWAVVPSFADLWVERVEAGYRIGAVRQGSPAALAGIVAGSRLLAVDDVAIEAAVAAFWADLGVPVTEERAAFAARVLAAGRRDRRRRLTLVVGGTARSFELPSLYQIARPERPPVSLVEEAGTVVIRINDALGDSATIAAFDAAMVRAGASGRRLVIDLRDTPSGGNTVVARAMLGWFVSRPTAYQVHSLPAEERATGIARQWIEQVLPRAGRRHRGPVRVLVGRWTGSMGEGLAIAFDAIGADVRGDPMAGLLGAIVDYPLGQSGLVMKLPTERLYAVDGTPREAFVPRRGGPRGTQAPPRG